MVEKNPTSDTSGNEKFDANAEPVTNPDSDRALKIVNALEGYRLEAEAARQGGPNGRDDKWEKNLNLYWNRYDFGAKAAWQAKETMPEVPQFVDRFAAALKEALIATPEGFYQIIDPSDKEGDLSRAIKRVTDVWLSTASRNQVGTPLHFSSVFEEQMKLGALMATASVTTWKNDRVSVETVDPRNIWLDPTFRNLYRIRKIELDRHELYRMAKATDGKGKPIFNLPEIERLLVGLSQDETAKREALVGHGVQATSNRNPIELREYIATVVGEGGEMLADKSLMVVANNKYLIRGPEANPFWHGRDWLVYAPLVTAPLSVYGRSYMEDFGSLANTFTQLTNMLLDAVHTTALKAYAIVPGMLVNPEQAADGISPNKTFLLEEGYPAKDFAYPLDLGNIGADGVRMWQMLKQELGEAAGMNEIGIGQFAPKGRTSATEITEVQQSSSALIRSVAQQVETRFLDPTLDLIWKTGIQHVSKDDKAIREAAGDEMFAAIIARRREFVSRPITFQARGISSLIQNNRTLKAILQLLGVIASNELLLKAFLSVVDLDKLVRKLFSLSGVDLYTLQTSEREKMIRSVTEPLEAAGQRVAGAPEASPETKSEMSSVAQMMGIGR